MQQEGKAPRFDKLILQHTAKKVLANPEEPIYIRFNRSAERKMKSVFPEPIMDPKKTKQ